MTYFDIVAELNEDILERCGEWEKYFEYRTSSYCDIILFDGIPLWNSEDDDRPYIEGTDEKGDLLAWIKEKFNEYADRISILKFE